MHQKKFILGLIGTTLACSLLISTNQTISANSNGKPVNITVDNSKSNTTKVIQSKINKVSKDGGGQVNIAAGKYNVKYLELKDNVDLHLSAGSKIVFSDKFSDFPAIQTRYEGQNVKMRHADIYAKNVKNASITGSGTIDGNGSAWWKMYNKAKEGPLKNADKIPFKYSRPYLVAFDNSSKIRITGITLQNSPAWTIHPLESHNVLIQGVTINNPLNSPNTDGIDPESSQNVKILDNTISDGDDCIAIKSGTEVTKHKSATKDVIISNNIMKHGHGGVTIGSEMSGGVSDITINNNIFDQTDRGIRMKTRRGRGGYIKNISVSNITMKNVLTPIAINAMYGKSGAQQESYLSDEKQKVDDSTPSIKNISLSNITATGVSSVAGFVYGIPESPVDGLRITNVNLYMKKNAEAEEPEMIDNAQKFADSGFWLKNTENTQLRDINIYGSKTGVFANNENNIDLVQENVTNSDQ